jgi:hypothetical protein
MAAAVIQADLDRLREDLRTDTQADLDRLREDLRTDIRTALSPRLGGVLRSLFLQLFHV